MKISVLIFSLPMLLAVPLDAMVRYTPKTLAACAASTVLKKSKKYGLSSIIKGLIVGTGSYELFGSDPDDQKDSSIEKFVPHDMAMVLEDQKQKLLGKGYKLFYHARSSNSNFVNDIWNGICALEQNKPISFDHIFLRFRDGKEDLQILNEHRKKLLQRGISKGLCIETVLGIPAFHKESEIVFMNKKISQNDSYLTQGECTGYYFKNNASSTSCDAGYLLKTLLDEHNLSHYFIKYKQKLEDLSELHKSCFKTGELLAIAIDNDYVDEMVYSSGRWGRKVSFFPKSKTLKKCKDLLNNIIPMVYATLLPRDYWAAEFGVRIFCFAVPDMPGEYGSKQQSGKYFITSWSDIDYKQYELYKKERDSLFVKICADKSNFT